MVSPTYSRRSFVTRAAVGASALPLMASPAVLRHAGAQQLTPVSLQLNWNPNAEHAPYYLGRELGYYEEVGIDIEIKPGQGSSAAAQLVGTGDSDFGVAVADAIIVARSQTIPVVSTAVLLQQTPTVLGSKAEQNILTPEDLYGKKVAVNPQSTVHAYWKAFVDVNELDMDQIEEVNVTGASLPLLIADQVDATGLLLTNEAVTLMYEGFDINIIYYSEYGVVSYGQCLFTNEEFAAANPDVAEAFVAATLKSWEYTLEHVDEAIDVLAEVVPETNKELETLKYDAILELSSNPEGTSTFGEQSLEGWTLSYETFERGGVIETAFDPQLLFTNDFLPDDRSSATPAT
jgi:NitT/TauT family transport system substrate-binding protein